jgi:hypothetical protein
MLINSPQIAESDESKIIEAVQTRYKDATDFCFNRVGEFIEDGNTYMVEFKTKETGRTHSCFYAYVDVAGCQVLEDGHETMGLMQTLLAKHRNFMKKIYDFNPSEIARPETSFLVISTYMYVAFLAIITTALRNCFESKKTIQPYTT